MHRRRHDRCRARDRSADAREIVLALAVEEHGDLAVFTSSTGRLRAKEACRALGAGTEPRHVEGMRSKLKKLVARGVPTELAAGLFELTTAAA